MERPVAQVDLILWMPLFPEKGVAWGNIGQGPFVDLSALSIAEVC